MDRSGGVVIPELLPHLKYPKILHIEIINKPAPVYRESGEVCELCFLIRLISGCADLQVNYSGFIYCALFKRYTVL